jgi:hypothetical protein
MKALDAFLPEYEFSEVHRVRVDAPPERVDAAVREIVAEDLAVVRVLTWLRGLGSVPRSRRRLVDLGTRLEDAPGEGLVLRFEGDFWRLRGSRRGDSCTAVLDFRVANGELTSETRVHVADPVARRKFARYWRAIRPFSGLIRIVFLREAKRRAEAAT